MLTKAEITIQQNEHMGVYLIKRRTMFHRLIKMPGVNNVEAQDVSHSLGDALGC